MVPVEWMPPNSKPNRAPAAVELCHALELEAGMLCSSAGVAERQLMSRIAAAAVRLLPKWRPSWCMLHRRMIRGGDFEGNNLRLSSNS
jgi:hypothetical protein